LLNMDDIHKEEFFKFQENFFLWNCRSTSTNERKVASWEGTRITMAAVTRGSNATAIYDDAWHTNVDQCYKFEPKTNLEVADEGDLSAVSKQGTILRS
jgi:hypothetical protein